MSERNYWERMRRGRMSRRTLLSASARAGVGAAGLALVGCGDDDDDGQAQQAVVQAEPQAQQAEQQAQAVQQQEAAAQQQDATVAQAQQSAGGPQYGGTVVLAGGDGGLFDPAVTIHGGTDASIFQIYDFLNYLDDGFVLTDAMCELPEVIDELNFVYNVKPNVHWQDKAPLNGRQFTAEDASFGLRRFGFDNPEFVFKDRYALIEDFEVVDELTLHLRASEPFSPLLTAVAEASALMVAQDTVDAFGDAEISTNLDAAIGTGSMMIVSRESGVETVIERNPNYYREGQPYFDGYRLIWFADAALRVASYVDGQLDFVNVQWYGELSEIEAVRDQVGVDEVVAVPNPATFGLAQHINTTVEPYTDARVRTALHLTADREALNAVTLGAGAIGGPICAAISPYGKTADELRQLPGYRSGDLRQEDLGEARKLLDASGADLDNIPDMEIWLEGAADYGQVLQQNFAEIGYEVGIRELNTADSLAVRQNHEFSMIVLGQQGAADPDLLYNDLHTLGGQNYGEFSDPEIDAMLIKGRQTFGVEDRKAIYDEIQDEPLSVHNPRIWWHWSLPTVGHRPYLKGFRPTPGITATNQVMNGCWFDGKPA